MAWGFDTITAWPTGLSTGVADPDLAAASARNLRLLRHRPYGVIDVQAGALQRIVLRPFPKWVSWPEVAWWGRWTHARRAGDRCLLYYNQPCGHRNYLALRYVVSTAGASFRTFRLAVRLLDEIARLKRSDAIFCDVANVRISDRLLARWGWEPMTHHWRRFFIKRFYGHYPAPLCITGNRAPVEASWPEPALS